MTAPPVEGPLQPLRAALLAAAAAQAAADRAAAEEDGRRQLAAATREAELVLAAAREQGADDAAALVAADRARNRQAARGAVLRARRRLYDELGARAEAAVRELLTDPDRRARLAQLVRARLGDDAVLRDTADGGLAGECADGRRVDASVAALVARALAATDLEQLW